MTKRFNPNDLPEVLELLQRYRELCDVPLNADNKIPFDQISITIFGKNLELTYDLELDHENVRDAVTEMFLGNRENFREQLITLGFDPMQPLGEEINEILNRVSPALDDNCETPPIGTPINVARLQMAATPNNND